MNPNLPKREPVSVGLRIQIDALALQKLWLWTDMARGEVSALGTVEEIRDALSGSVTTLLVTDFYLVRQSCTTDETTMDPASVAELLTMLEAQGIDCRKLRCWTHSHGNMSVFWSGQDNDCISGLANGEWLLSLVVNKKHDTLLRLDQYYPAHLYLTDVLWDVKYPLVNGLAEQCLAEFKAKVQEVTGLARFTLDHKPRTEAELKQAYERGALTADDLAEEMWWDNLEMEELGEERPF